MGKPKNDRRVQDNEARAFAKYVDSSVYKLNLVAEMIRGHKAGKALTDLEFSRKRVAKEVRKVLLSAVSNAENNHNLDVDRLIVSEATVGKSLTLKRFHARGRGRGARVEKFFSNLTIVVREAAE
jgi:large subunit ribosomal protein L22